MKIQKIIHQIWLGSEDVNKKFKQKWPDSWKIHHPDWEYKLWTDKMADDFVRCEYPYFHPVWSSYDHMIKRVDSLRYMLMYKYGGIYADMDFMCLKPLDKVFSEHNCYLIPEPEVFDHNLCNGLIASALGHPFWDACINALPKTAHKPILEATGPGFISNIYQTFQDKKSIHIIKDREIFTWSGSLSGELENGIIECAGNVIKLSEKTHAIHFGRNSWA